MADIDPGRYEAEIVRHEVVHLGQKGTPAVRFEVDIAGESMEMLVWISMKSEGAIRFARAALKKCGFDPDTQELEDLNVNPYLLRGTVVEVDVYEDDYGGRLKLKCDLAMGSAKQIDRAAASKLNAALRSAKSDDEPDVAPTPPPSDMAEGTRRLAGAAPGPASTEEIDDIPFAWLLPFILPLLAVGGLA